MVERDNERKSRPLKRRQLPVFGGAEELTPEEIAAKNAAETAKKIRAIFARKPPKAA